MKYVKISTTLNVAATTTSLLLFSSPRPVFADPHPSQYRKSDTTTAQPRSNPSSGPELTEAELKAIGKVESPYKVCKDQMLVDSELYKKNETQWRAAGGRGAYKGTVEIVPTTHVFKSFDGSSADSQPGRLGINEYLLKVGERAAADLTKGLEEYSQLKACVNSNSTDETCKKLRNGFFEPMKAKASDFRRAMGQISIVNQDTESNFILRSDTSIYTNLKGSARQAGVFGPKEDLKLDASDIAYVKKSVRDAFDLAKSDYTKMVESKITTNNLSGDIAARERMKMMDSKVVATNIASRMQDHKQKAMGDYFKLLTEVPQLAYISDAGASNKELGEAIEQMITDGKEQLEKINKIIASEKNRKSNSKELNKDLLRFASYSAVAEKILGEESKSNNGKPLNCAIATAAYNEAVDSKSLRDYEIMAALVTAPIGIATGGPRMAALVTGGRFAMTAAAAGHMAIGVGIGGGLLSSYADYKTGENAERDVRTGLTKPEDAKDDMNTGAMAGPLSVLNFGGSKALVGGAAGLIGRSLMRGNTTVLAKSARMTPEALADLIKKAQAGDTASVEKVKNLSKLTAEKYLGGKATTEDELILQSLDNAGLLGLRTKPNIEVLSDIGEATRNLSANDRKAVANKVLEIFKKAEPPTGLTGKDLDAWNDRAKTVAKVALGMARNGVDNADAVGKMLADSQWTKESLEGVDRVLTEARKNLKGSGIPTAEKRAAAVQDSIAQLQYGKKYSALKEEEKKQVSQMCVCAFSCSAKSVAEDLHLDSMTTRTLAACTIAP